MKELGNADRTQGKAPLARLDAGEFENLLDHFREPAPLVAHQLSVAPDAGLVMDDAIGKILRRRSNDGERRSQFVRHGGDEFHLLRRQALSAPRREDQQAHARAEQAQHARTDKKVAATLRADRGLERSGRVRNDEAPLWQR